MDIIIAGDGEVGFYLAKLLSKENHNITIIDPKTDFINLVENENNILAISGDSTSVKILKENNVKKADLFISVVHDERTNIITAMLAKQLGAKRTIARISNPEYLDIETTKFFKSIGIDNIVCPERIAAEEILSLLNATGATEIVNFSQGQLSLILIKIQANSPYANKTIAEINAINPELIFRCVAVLRSDKTIMPKDSDIILPHDLVYMVVKIKEIDKAIEDAGIKKFSVKNVMIIGGGRIGVKTAQRIENKMNVKLFEIDKQKARRLANTLENTLVVNADCRDIDSLEEEEIGQMDAFVALTNYSETNIIACLIAKRYGIKRVIALVDNVEFIGIAQNIDIDTTINRKLITASHIAKYTMEAKAASVTYLQGIDADVMDLVAMPNSKATKKPIRHIGLPEGAIIGGIVRNKIGHIATGDFQIEPYDNVIVFALPSAFIKVQTLF